ncbi:MAG: hypothetical protein ACREH5_04555 [Candidatus Omnitrophota bacterium]
MKITTDIPSQAASAFEIVDRDVTSTVDIHQDALYPVPLLPAELIAPGFAGARQRSSVAVDQYARIINPGAQVANTFISLGRGLWRITGRYSYASNFAGILRLAGGSLAIVNAAKGQNVMVFNAIAAVGIQTGDFSFDLLADDENYNLDFFLGAPPAVGNDHQLAIAVVASKYL